MAAPLGKQLQGPTNESSPFFDFDLQSTAACLARWRELFIEEMHPHLVELKQRLDTARVGTPKDLAFLDAQLTFVLDRVCLREWELALEHVWAKRVHDVEWMHYNAIGDAIDLGNQLSNKEDEVKEMWWRRGESFGVTPSFIDTRCKSYSGDASKVELKERILSALKMAEKKKAYAEECLRKIRVWKRELKK